MVRVGLIDPTKATNYAAEYPQLYVKATGPGALAGSLSGGDLQKFIMGARSCNAPRRWSSPPADLGRQRRRRRGHPQAIVNLAARGSAHGHLAGLLDELLTLCDTIGGYDLGRLSAPMKVGEDCRSRKSACSWAACTATRRRPSNNGPCMRIRLEKRLTPSRFMQVATPVASVLLTMLLGAVIFELISLTGRTRSTRPSSPRSSPPTNGSTS